MLYFAYGSNMDCAQMRERCPSASFVAVAELRDYKLAFTRESKHRRCGVADAVQMEGRSVWGVVYQVSELDLEALDEAEGFRPGRASNSYWRRECVVYLGGDEGRPLTVQTYFAEREPNPPLPSQAYKALILRGARFWRLPDAYIRELEAIPVGQ